MINFTKFISVDYDNLKTRIIKVLRYGKNDVQTSVESSPYGLDSNPIKDMIAIYAVTNEADQNAIIGYINKNQLADIGEFRTYSTDSNGQLKFYTWLKNDGTYEIGGNSKHLARFEELKSGFDALKDDFNNFVNTVYNAHMHPTAGTGAPSPPTLPGTQSTASIDSSKIDEIKTL